jgi:hypothetical protein
LVRKFKLERLARKKLFVEKSKNAKKKNAEKKGGKRQRKEHREDHVVIK